MSENTNKENIELTEEQKKELLKSFFKKALDDNNKSPQKIDDKIETLKKLKSLYEKKSNDFKVGDIIRWKKLLKNKALPDYDEPIIILEILKEPIFNTKEQIGSTYYNEINDIKVGIIKDNSFLFFYFDSSRFELYE